MVPLPGVPPPHLPPVVHRVHATDGACETQSRYVAWVNARARATALRDAFPNDAEASAYASRVDATFHELFGESPRAARTASAMAASLA